MYIQVVVHFYKIVGWDRISRLKKKNRKTKTKIEKQHLITIAIQSNLNLHILLLPFIILCLLSQTSVSLFIWILKSKEKKWGFFLQIALINQDLHGFDRSWPCNRHKKEIWCLQLNIKMHYENIILIISINENSELSKKCVAYVVYI